MRPGAEAEPHRALHWIPPNWLCVVLLGMLAFNEREMDAARTWYLFEGARCATVFLDPLGDALGHCVLASGCARATQPSHASDRSHRDFEKAAALDALNADAMPYLSLLAGATRRGAVAARWQEKADDARSERLQAAIAGAAPLRLTADDPVSSATTAMRSASSSTAASASAATGSDSAASVH